MSSVPVAPPEEHAGHPAAERQQAEWTRRFTSLTLAWLTFETLSGLAAELLPFSVPNQWLVLWHTVLGLLFLPPVALFHWRHLRAYWSQPRSAPKWMGYLGLLALLAALASGLVLTQQALLGPRISWNWDRVHVLSTYALIAFALPHVAIALARHRAAGRRQGWQALLDTQRRMLAAAGGLGLLLLVPPGVSWLLYPGERLVNEFPADYSFKYGRQRPFAPSLANTPNGGALDARALSGSESCGTAGCHEQIVAECRVSAHRWSAMDPAFQRIQEEMARQNGIESTRYCSGCHDPISLFSGAKNVFAADVTGLPGYNEGVSCLVCHSIRQTDIRGNANFVMAQPPRYLFELREGRGARLARDFLIRAYPRRHAAALSKRLFRTPEYCAACHKQFVDKEINNVGWVQIQNQYDNWRKSRWNRPGDATRTIECRECHMPLQDSRDPAAGDALDYNRNPADGRHRSHRFLGANQAMPVLLRLPGGEQQVRLVESWLRGEYKIPEIADKWPGGPAVALELQAPAEATAGEAVTVRAVITSRKVGHDFPTGPLDVVQAWIELRVTDAAGREVFASGRRDKRHFIEPGTFLFKAEPVDQYGKPIDRHNLWDMVGVRYRRALFPDLAETADFTIHCSSTVGSGVLLLDSSPLDFTAPRGAVTAGNELHVTARLLYRKADQYLVNLMFGEQSGLTMPVTEVARAEARIQVRPTAVRRPAADAP